MKTFNAEFTGTHKGRIEEPVLIKAMVAGKDEHDAAMSLECNYDGIEGLCLSEVERDG